MFDIVSNAKITVEEDAALDAVEGALTISASVDQTANLIDLLGTDTDTDWMNFFNVKVGDALVKIFGDLTAKTDVIVSAKANVTMEVSNSVLSTLYVPVSFAVSSTEASVEVVGSSINAGGDVMSDNVSVATAEQNILFSAKHRYILCDSSKIGQSAVAHITNLKNCDGLITGYTGSEITERYKTLTEVLYA
jgi:hypothetical protein